MRSTDSPNTCGADTGGLSKLLRAPEKLNELVPPLAEGQLRIGYVPGVIPGKWFSRWRERYSHKGYLVELPLAEASGVAALTAWSHTEDGAVRNFADMVLLRPEQEVSAMDGESFHLIDLYREKMVVILPKDHVLSLFEHEVPLGELSEESMLQPPESIPEWAEISQPYQKEYSGQLPKTQNVQDSIDLVAAGTGLVIVPMSVARLYHRSDLTYRIVAGLRENRVALCWSKQSRSDSDEQNIQDFIGICRGRTARSGRGCESQKTEGKKTAREKALARAQGRKKSSRQSKGKKR